ncbi:hypothetical protein HanRHA438_Chr07g0293071 [Helianthus annuus]|uniref:Uncharacterized protein n=1 Tax=Helianthus annuus TaxID=4232 RepID=A0A251U9L6_HELAN|nr:hypothetical protein HanXRQr2_Chr07g0282521 [Helianthus annuus]KAJ0903731.1 hypothetical protein HanPSC8_Chr07g0273331 [Helianthus annuus]KAJ0906946.1 hypothetical protein HanRHA438_Chr07g0293071 [Helianthus annuus]
MQLFPFSNLFPIENPKCFASTTINKITHWISLCAFRYFKFFFNRRGEMQLGISTSSSIGMQFFHIMISDGGIDLAFCLCYATKLWRSSLWKSVWVGKGLKGSTGE